MGCSHKKANIPIWKTAFTALLATEAAATTPAEKVVEPVVNQKVEEAEKQVEDVPKIPTKNTPKIALAPASSRKFRPSAQKNQSESLKPSENKESLDLPLYGGFGMGEASTSQNLKNSSSFSDSTSRPITKAEQAERKRGELELQHVEIMAQQERYYVQLQERHRAIKEIEDQRKTLEYQQTAKSSFAVIRRILGLSEANSRHCTPSPPP